MGVRIETAGAAAVMIMDWPERRNALRPQDGEEVAAAIAATGEAATSAVILTGTRAFYVSGDLRTFAELSATHTPAEIVEQVYGRIQAMIRALRRCPVPTIAAVDGPAIGLGFDLALACDMRLLGPHGWFRQGWARAGLIAGTGGIGLLARRTPDVSWRLIATHEKVTIERCPQLGLGEVAPGGALAAIDRVVPGHHCRMEREQTWPDDDFSAETARVRAGLICSPQFRDLAARALGTAAPVA